ncbi:helix-turn-helix domain-containing protein (plasmid) [Agrobacterium rosae]|uniref:helix-turn-helix domain-containing protein n=1 Tax=Agrobacterium rosae TaxID=1972867 RepID=UPI002A0D2A0F|nr:helix-turn-helix domain-containing protein [Agrobacterium rosae]MDX8316036.1 helix-turn-helix domain-containing protein [Agrobacterium rosae]
MEKSGFMGRRSAETEGPHPVDIHVGQRVRMRRNQVGMFQTTLGADLGITFQQVQKYKRGSNRISPSKLYEIANALSVPITYFFEDLTPGDKIEREPVAALERHKEYLSSKEGCKLIDPMSKLPRSLRLKILPLLVALQPVDEAHDDGSDT